VTGPVVLSDATLLAELRRLGGVYPSLPLFEAADRIEELAALTFDLGDALAAIRRRRLLEETIVDVNDKWHQMIRKTL
jgi:hypothetical protein